MYWAWALAGSSDKSAVNAGRAGVTRSVIPDYPPSLRSR
jgi:hypothetical protein